MSTTLYGISNCDAVKKARNWLDKHGIVYHFHDFRKDGLDITLIKSWLTYVGSDTLINKRGTTFRNLSASNKLRIEKDPHGILQEYPTLIKRPVLNTGKQLFVGFSETQYQSLFRTHTL
jgi:arsenate reductase